MLHDREQFDVRITQFLDVWNELIGELAVSQPTVAVFWNAAPRAEMNLVNGDGRVEPILFFARSKPVAVVPEISVQVRDDGASLGTKLRAERVRIGFERE